MRYGRKTCGYYNAASPQLKASFLADCVLCCLVPTILLVPGLAPGKLFAYFIALRILFVAMAILTTLVAAWALMASGASAAGAPSTSANIGPAAFMWPPDRVWSADADNTAPCGSISGVQNRTTFPLRQSFYSLA